MNEHLNEAIFGIAKADAIMRSIEAEYMNTAGLEKGATPGELLFYALWDQIRKVADELDLLSGDSRVVDVINAVREAERQRTLKTKD